QKLLLELLSAALGAGLAALGAMLAPASSFVTATCARRAL
ncbi:hypothetical protein A2U01_0098845, partial [Trifolium medium]|nr:hypothetical protein [Trifolium medium]